MSTETMTKILSLSLFLVFLVILLSQIDALWSTGEANFKYFSYDEIVEEIHKLEKEHPDLVEVTDAQSKYGIKSPGECGSSPCKQWIVRITNEKTLSENSMENKESQRPEVFFSGELHGNERIGPSTLVVFMKLLVESYSRNDNQNPWLKYLVDNRSIYIMPMTNALGYYQNRREENSIDPNRDFPIDLSQPDMCMRTITARAVNELWREHLFQVAITFHGGMRAIAYEWGTVTERTKRERKSPDDVAQSALGSALSAYAGVGPEKHKRYPHNRINDVVYPVRGGMEDWAYAGSWYKGIKKPCSPTSFGGYPMEKTVYTDSQLRVLNYLVETSDNKSPPTWQLGSMTEILRPDGSGNGHIPRNVRLALLMTDVVEPYNMLVELLPLGRKTRRAYDQNETEMSLNSSKLAVESQAKCTAPISEDSVPKTESVPHNDIYRHEAYAGESLMISWEVGGSFHVDATHAVLTKWPSEEFELDLESPGFGWTESELESRLEIVHQTNKLSGPTRWAGGGLFGSVSDTPETTLLEGKDFNLFGSAALNDRGINPVIPAWKACLNVPTTTPGTKYALFIVSTVDQKWKQKTSSLGPQSHLVNARTNPNWNMTNNGHRIRGRLKWYSKPVEIIIAALQEETSPNPNPIGNTTNKESGLDSSVHVSEYEYELDEYATLKPTSTDREKINTDDTLRSHCADASCKTLSPAIAFFSDTNSMKVIIASVLVGIMFAAACMLVYHCRNAPTPPVRYQKIVIP